MIRPNSLIRTAILPIGYRAATDLVGKCSTLLIMLFAARILLTSDFGLLSLAFLTGWLIAVASDFGLQVLLAREVALNPGGSLATFKYLLKRRTLSAVGFFLVSILFTLTWVELPMAAAFLFIVAAQILLSTTEFTYYLFRGLSRSDLESSLVLGSRPTTAVILIAALTAWPALMTVGVTLFLSSAAGLTVTLWVAWQQGARKTRGPSVLSRPLRRSVLRTVSPIGAGILLSALYFRSDLYLVQWFRGIEAVAHYDAAFRLVDALRLLPAAVLAVVFPKLCTEDSVAHLTTCSGALFLVAGGIALGVGWQADFIVGLTFGRAFSAAVPLLRILLLALPLLYVNYLLTHQLIAWGLQVHFAVFCGLGLVVNLGLNLGLIPTVGVQGAAWATILTELFLFGCWVWILVAYRRRYSKGNVS